MIPPAWRQSYGVRASTQPFPDSTGATRGVSYWHCRHDADALPLGPRHVFHVAFLLRQKGLPRELVTPILDLAGCWIWEPVPSCTKQFARDLTDMAGTGEHRYGTEYHQAAAAAAAAAVTPSGTARESPDPSAAAAAAAAAVVDDLRPFARLRAFVFRLEVTSVNGALRALPPPNRGVHFALEYAGQTHVATGWIEPLARPSLRDGYTCQLGEVVAVVDRADEDAMIRAYVADEAPRAVAMAPPARGSGPVRVACMLDHFPYRLGPHCLHALYALS